MKIVDTFSFCRELDLLEIRLNSLAPYVEKFVLCESEFTHSGNPKELYFNDNKERFKDFNIVHLVCGLKIGTPYEREIYQRNYLMNGIMDDDPETIILHSDVDEIPDLTNYKGEEGAFKQKMYYYFLNVFTNTGSWRGTIATKRKNIKTIETIRALRNRTIPFPGWAGWHFSTLGTPEQIIEKIESFCHQDYNTPENKGKIAENRKNLVDPYNRKLPNFTVEMPSGPKWLLENKDKYEHLFYKNQ